MATQKKNDKVFGKYTKVSKRVNNLEVNEITSPKQSGKYRGTSVARDDNGFFVTTHRARSGSYSSPEKILDNKIKFIRNTG